MTGRHSAAAAVVALLCTVIGALVLRIGLALWTDCGRACGFHASASVQPIERPRAAR